MSEKIRLYDVYESGLSDATGVIRDGRVDIYEVIASNMSGADLFFQLFDLAAAPTAGAVPRRSYKVPAGTALSISYREGREYNTGASFGWSSTYDTFTDASATQVSVDVDYKVW